MKWSPTATIRRWIRANSAASLCAAMLLSCGPAAAQQTTADGERVVSIRVADESAGAAGVPPANLPLQEGQPFDIERERESLKALFRTGLYADIHTDAVPVAGGVRIDFVVRRNFYNGVVRVEGLKDPRDQALAIASLHLGLGETFRETNVQEALVRLAEALQQEGLYRTTAKYALEPHADTRQMDITVQVTPGPRARVGPIQLHNQTEFSDHDVLGHAKLHAGQEIRSALLDKATQRLRKYLAAHEHLGGRVLLRRGDYDAQTNAVPLALTVVAGPKVRVEVTGAHFSKSRVHKLIPIFEEGTVDDDLLLEGNRNLRDALQRNGYFDAAVQYSNNVDEKHGEQVITYTVDRGKQHRMVGVEFTGNEYFSCELLTSRLAIQPASFANRGRFSEDLLHSDVDSIRGLYVANGFRDVQVTTDPQDNYRGHPNNLFVRFRIVEGGQIRVGALKLAGNKALTGDELRDVIGATPGQPYSESAVASDRDNVLALYFNEGFPDARFEALSKPAAAPAREDLTYQIVEGQQVRVGSVLLSGYKYTRPGLIQRQVKVKPGDPLRESSVIETQRNLYNLGIFNRVTVAKQNPAGTTTDKNIVVDVEEGKRYTISYGFGLEAQRLGGVSGSPVGSRLDFSPLGIFEISKSNVGGRAQTVALKLRASTLEYRGLLSYTIPDFFSKKHFSLQVTGFAEKSRDIQTFTSTRYEGSIQLAQTLTPFSSFLYRYTFRRVLIDASTLKVPIGEIPLLSQPTRVSGFGGTWLRDHRDNPADASRGSFNTVDVGVALKAIGSKATFLRTFIQNSTFYPIGRSLVFARSTQFGVEQPFQGSIDTDIPLPERFFAGGGTSLRGFSLNQAGPRDPTTGFPIGGLALLVFNQELRFPMHLPLIGTRLGGAVFYDAGNVYSSVDRITFRAKPASPADLEYFSHTIGYGLRYATPVGPVRLDLGYQLNPAQFSFLNSAGVTQLARLPHFQFFFNIGAIF